MLSQDFLCFQTSVIALVPPVATLLAKSPLLEKYDLSFVQCGYCGAAPVALSVINQLKARLPKYEFRQSKPSRKILLSKIKHTEMRHNVVSMTCMCIEKDLLVKSQLYESSCSCQELGTRKGSFHQLSCSVDLFTIDSATQKAYHKGLQEILISHLGVFNTCFSVVSSILLQNTWLRWFYPTRVFYSFHRFWYDRDRVRNELTSWWRRPYICWPHYA